MVLSCFYGKRGLSKLKSFFVWAAKRIEKYFRHGSFTVLVVIKESIIGILSLDELGVHIKILKKLIYKEILQADGAFSVTHVNYCKFPVF